MHSGRDTRAMTMMSTPAPFRVPVDADAINDLHRRLDLTRWSDALDRWT